MLCAGPEALIKGPVKLLALLVKSSIKETRCHNSKRESFLREFHPAAPTSQTNSPPQDYRPLRGRKRQLCTCVQLFGKCQGTLRPQLYTWIPADAELHLSEKAEETLKEPSTDHDRCSICASKLETIENEPAKELLQGAFWLMFTK
ncbi:hypothetical protein Y1Q_0012848 [Alligator mississippiensis]|uniref:Uncharacterized protein n=1 Tax=Alligator mississippiensis TaxID=8496 RepID=A0A151P480_ALLMI|nr:hypothetical protein Y1Q_0012848 [Alligator mississippiensis]